MMSTKSVTVELDDETIRELTVLGAPVDVLARLAFSVAEGVRRPEHARRVRTDQSLRDEREKTDVALASERNLLEEVANDVVRVARRRADQIVQSARTDADSAGPPGSDSAAERTRADSVLEDERISADEVLTHERTENRRVPERHLAAERTTTDNDLSSERAHTDRLVLDQRDANERLVSATIRAQDLTLEADAAKERAEAGEKELRMVAEFREMFIAILGHDLRTPLGSIVLSADVIMRDEKATQRQSEAAARILRSGHRMSRMITQLLDLTRARLGGGLPIDRKPADLREICRNVVEEFAATIQMEFLGDATGSWDSDRIAEVLSNLIGNAVEYSTPGTVIVVRGYEAESDVVVEVSNLGPPIPANVLPFIFEPFRRVRQREKSPTGNLGLGLYIAQQVVLSHGGTLTARSADGTTTFSMRLPRAARPSTAPTASTE